MHTDLQTIVALALGLLAAAYLARRWWPGVRGVFAKQPPASSLAPKKACGSTQVQAPAASCGNGCGNCGHNGAAPTKDHRVHVVRRTTH